MSSPSRPVFTTVVGTSFGSLLCAVDGTGILVGIHFARRGVEAAVESLEAQGLSPDAEPIPPVACERLEEVRRQLVEYFAGQRRVFDLPLAAAGTPFQQAVWRQLQEIPFGEVRSYGEIARAIGQPAASRAVGAANGANPIPVVIPCHRVIGADGSLTGFGGGLDWKVGLLELEGAWPPRSARAAAEAQLDLFAGLEA